MAIEVEARFRVTDASAVTRLSSIDRLGPAELGPPAAFEQTDEYLDTADGLLAAARWACRLRQRDGVAIVSLKGPPEPDTDGWLHRRPELEGPATSDPDPAGWPASDARALLDTLRGGHPLAVQVTLRQHRTERSVTVEGVRTGVLSLDHVVVASPDAPVGAFGIVELELAGQAGAPHLPALAAALGSIGGLVAEPRSKLEAALELLGSVTGPG
ncbi:MAG: CYTH domain-containing protein [Chloroflexota bacterium]|nr:CYTH domain-containing protein [Chloroflexota bacterium]